IIACLVVGGVFVALAFVAGAQGTSSRTVRVATATTVPAPKPTPATATPAVRVDSAKQLVTRETYSYAGDSRRDPFVSLMNSEELRPLYQDLKLVAVAWDATGRNSVAVLRDVTSKEQYRVKVGQEL